MRYLTVTSVGLAAVMLVGAPAYTQAQSTTEKPSATERMEQKADEAGSKVKSMAREAKTNVTDSWVTSKTKIALFASRACATSSRSCPRRTARGSTPTTRRS